MDSDLGMEGACIPWLNKHDIEPLLVNAEAEYTQQGDIPGIRIFRAPGRREPFDIYFCKTKFNAYTILMGLDREQVEARMVERSCKDLEFLKNLAPDAERSCAGSPSPPPGPQPLPVSAE